VQLVIQLSDTDFRIIVSCVVLLALLLVRLAPLRRHAMLAYGFAGIVGAAAWFNFGLQFHQWSDGFANLWDLFHYQLGAKYFPELGYDGLYAASVMAQRESAPELPEADIRDLVSNRMVSLDEYESFLREVRSRFSDERWQEFVEDHHQYIETTSPLFFRRIRQDHGYNPTPAWTFYARLFAAHLGSTPAALGLLGSLDIALVVLMFAIVFRTYGFRAGCLALAIAGLGFGWRYQYIGSLLRLDWLAALVIGICMLKRERFVAAGACIGFAVAVRVFPLLVLAGPGLLAVKAWIRGERPRWPFEIAAGLVAVLVISGLGGAMTGRGFLAWAEFARDIQVHRETWGTNQVGLDTLFLSGPSYLIGNLEEPAHRRTRKEVAVALAKDRAGRAAAAIFALALTGLAAWRARLDEATALGIVAIFVLTPASSYYWIMALVVCLRRGDWIPFGILALATGMYAAAMHYSTAAYQPFLYGLFSWGMALLLLAWVLPDALRQLREWIPIQMESA